ncbi:hypothetical protein CTI12_AA531670 [Artemisia annua]|uniref:Uncharacterized protein n=1 Tax=Artemisia annua TaxID=35608 RepID=A0A2U1L4W6_ARTAN|nr:hypothetical protein CTI12_AA531670 [Artemisia annua]
MASLIEVNRTINEEQSFDDSECSSTSSLSDHEEFPSGRASRNRSTKWKKLMKKIVQESKKSIYGSSKPFVYRYDAVSYSLNFDEGNNRDEYYLYGSRFSQVLSEC